MGREISITNSSNDKRMAFLLRKETHHLPESTFQAGRKFHYISFAEARGVTKFSGGEWRPRYAPVRLPGSRSTVTPAATAASALNPMELGYTRGQSRSCSTHAGQKHPFASAACQPKMNAGSAGRRITHKAAQIPKTWDKPMKTASIDYLRPDVPEALDWVEAPLVRATADSLRGFGLLVEDYHDFPIEIVRWPAQGWRPVDPGTGDEGGTTRGTFECWWEGDILYGSNEAVGGQYLLGWADNPGRAVRDPTRCAPQSRVLLWHANYHPDGGQLFFPLDGRPFVVPLALPGDDLRPSSSGLFISTDARACTSTPTSGTRGSFPWADAGGFMTSRARCTPASVAASPGSSRSFWRCRSRPGLEAYNDGKALHRHSSGWSHAANPSVIEFGHHEDRRRRGHRTAGQRRQGTAGKQRRCRQPAHRHRRRPGRGRPDPRRR